MKTLRVVLGDQLSRQVAALRGAAAGDVVLMAEVMGECTYVAHHPQKIVLVLSAMRHFAAALAEEGFSVRYVRLDDEGNTQSLRGEVARAVAALRPARVVVTAAAEWRVLEDVLGWEAACGVKVEVLEDDRFLASRAFFEGWARGKTQLRMEFFYREMRRAHGVLMEGDAPVGGKWNFDSENRKALPKGLRPRRVRRLAPDEVTGEVMALVRARFAGHYGELEGFDYPVTAAQAASG